MSDEASQPNAPGKRLEDVIALTILRQIERDECALRNVIIDFDSGVSPGEARAKLEKLVKRQSRPATAVNNVSRRGRTT